jgi:tetratricopeptide (TPR) repeat protein
MARYDKSRPKRPKQDAAVAPARPRTRTPQPAHYEDTMFFPRLRKQAKWMFVFLALVFGLGFVGFGVGAGGVGVGDVFRGSGGSGVQSVSDARGETEDRPRDPEAWRDLATALETEGETAEAVAALDTAVELAPRDASSLRRLAGLRLALASERQRDAQLLQIAAVYQAPSQVFPGLIGTGGQPIAQDPLASAITGSVSERVTAALQDAGAQATQAVTAYKRLVALQPDDPNVQLELAQAAQQTGDSATAIGAYEAFLELAPDDPSATIVREQLKQLRQSAASGAG